MKISPPPSRAAVKVLALVAAVAFASAWLARGPSVPAAGAQAPPPPNYKNFEAPQVHPLAMTPDGTRLLAVNTPAGRLSVFDLSGGAVTLAAEIPVGLEPVSVAARSDTEAWVVNWLSDSVSVVDLTRGIVARTFDVGDEPTDVLFANNGGLAFVCVSGPSQVKLYSGSSDTPQQVFDIRGKQPRALSLWDDQGLINVFVTVFESGNQTTIVPESQVRAGGGAPPPLPALAAGLPPPPSAGLIVRRDGSGWSDERGDGRWAGAVPYTLADVDVALIRGDLRTGPAFTQSDEIRGVGTINGNAVFDPATRRLLVLNLDARNHVRFEPNLRGRFVNNRLSVVNFGPKPYSVTPLDLNPHINYGRPAGSDAERAKSLALPADIARAADGTLYVAATGSNKVGVLSSQGAVRARVAVGQGPTGLALDESRSRLYVLNRFDGNLSVVDTRTRAELSRVAVGFNPEPAQVRAGRRFLYDTTLSAHGDVSCATCHLNGHRDGLAWDLGDPGGQMQQVFAPNPIAPFTANFHPMKGPMTTQSLRGILATPDLQTTGPLHWRGDRANLAAFNPAFVSLLGGARELTADETAAFTAFVRSLTYPPNPVQNPDRTYPNPATGPSAARGQQLYLNARLDGGVLTCNQCHQQAQFGQATNGTIIPAAFLQEPQDFKVPQIRGLYQKLGLQRAAGEQLTGYGFAHDGSFATLLDFLRSPVFTFQNDGQRRDVIEFLLAFDTGTAPAVGLQTTVRPDNRADGAVLARLELLMAQCAGNSCDLVAKGAGDGQRRGYVFVGNRTFRPDRQSEPNVTVESLLQSLGANSSLTFTGVPDGTGTRVGIDQDGDGSLDGDEQPDPLTISGQVVGAAGQPLAGVTVTLAGAQGGATQTDAAGRYSFAGLPGGGYTVAPALAGLAFAPASQSFGGASGALSANFVAPADVEFSAASFAADESAASASVTVTRTGDTSAASSVSYSTVDDPSAVRCDDTATKPGVAFARCDYATTVDTVTFAPGETQKQITIPLINDAHAEPDETITLRLGDSTAASPGAKTAATLTVRDDDAAGAANPVLDATHAGNQFFVRQQYLDFLSREPEGGEPWTNVLDNCPAGDATCDRVRVSSAFFGSAEFQLKGYFVFRFYKVSLGRLPLYAEIIPDMRGVTGTTPAEVFAKRDAFAASWIERPEFVALYPVTLSETEYVDRLLQTAQVTLAGAVTRDTLVADLRSGAKSRADVLRAVVEHPSVDAREFNSAFVAMQYYGYLRRDPEPQGYQNWLNTINANPADSRAMVNGFVNSNEYRLRFGRP